MKVIIPENLVGKELYKFLMANKKELIAAKKQRSKRPTLLFTTPRLSLLSKLQRKKLPVKMDPSLRK
jgi:hypothetical protein